MSESLSDAERARYSRHLLLPQVGEAGQLRLRRARVLLIGLGGLGSPCALYLAAAGVGTLGLADHDTVALHNLQRQILHRESDVGRPKWLSGADTLSALNPAVRLIPHKDGFTPANARELAAEYDIIVDGSDNFATRHLANDAAVLEKKPLVSASVFRFEGQISVYDPASGGPCYRCLFPEPPAPGTAPGCSEAGVFGALCGIMGAMQAMEVVKLVTGAGVPLRGRLLMHDALGSTTRTLMIPRNPDCPCCGEHPVITGIDPARYDEAPCPTALEKSPDPLSSMKNPPLEISIPEATAWLASEEPPLVLDVREDSEVAICRIAGSTHIPMGQIPARLAELPRDRAILVQCHHGGRSLRVTQFLRANGLARVTNLKGGIDKWAVQVEPGMPRY